MHFCQQLLFCPLQDLEITRGYIPGFNAVLGHEFVGVSARLMEACGSM